ncbi:MAG: acylphosphatase [Candidatus Omnitrophica bacterium]|nr:acylphosphatase [Candidatus Omnitrophota bacterium]
MKLSRNEIIFKGRVQGVGFRYTAREYARDLGLSGWVRNLGDGSVQLVVEGDENIILELIRKLEDNFVIQEKLISRSPPHGDSDRFEIVH